MRSSERILRHVMHLDWRCKHCREIFGAENINHYGAEAPNMIKPTWFFASMALLDHLRDCRETDFCETLRAQFGDDFLNHPRIWEWFNIHATIDRKLVAEQELEYCE